MDHSEAAPDSGQRSLVPGVPDAMTLITEVGLFQFDLMPDEFHFMPDKFHLMPEPTRSVG